ncbi:hypothetical protein ACHWQZ_G005254 [Mnemiopsis leidyi]
MSQQSDDLKFSQESLSLLLTGGATGVPIDQHLPLSGLYSPDPNVGSDSRFPRVSSSSSMSSFSTPRFIQATQAPAQHTLPAAIPPVVEQELRTDNMQGTYNFNLRFEVKSEYPKNYPHCFSEEKDTLIVKDQTPIPFTMTSSYSMRDLKVRVTAVYSSNDNFHIPVLPCNNHSSSSQGIQKEFISCNNASAQDVKEDGRHHIILSLAQCRDVSGNGTELVENFEFNCRSSCSMKSKGSKGINNRALSLIFQLETNDGVAVGRRVFTLKVAVSPGRDIMTLMKQDSKRARKRSRTESISSGSGKTSPKAKEPKKDKPKSVSSSHKYTVVCEHKRTQKLITTLAKHCGVLDEVYLGDEKFSQTSVGTQENGSQPDLYSLEGWLSRYGLECYAQRLDEIGLGAPSQFQCLQESDLDKLEIFDKCHRLTLLHAAKRILIRGVKNIVKGECS